MPRMPFAAVVVSLAVLVSGGSAVLPGPASAAPRSPDLVVGKVGVKGALVVGARVRAVDVTRNRGRTVAGRSVTRYVLSKNKRLDKSDIKVGQRKVGRLKPGRKSKAAVRLRIPKRIKPGKYHLLVCADATRKVRESNERNNCRLARKKKYAVQVAPVAQVQRIPVRVTGTLTSTMTYRSGSIDRDEAITTRVDSTGFLDTYGGRAWNLELQGGGTIDIDALKIVENSGGCWKHVYAGYGWEPLTPQKGPGFTLGIGWTVPGVNDSKRFSLRVGHQPRHPGVLLKCDDTPTGQGSRPAIGVGNASEKNLTYTATLNAGHTRLAIAMTELVTGSSGGGSWSDKEVTTGTLVIQRR